MSITKILESPKNKVIAVALVAVLALSGVAMAMGGVFASSTHEFLAPDAPAGASGSTQIRLLENGAFTLPMQGMNTSGGRFLSHEDVATVNLSGSVLTVTPLKAGKTTLTVGALNNAYVGMVDYWIKDEDSIKKVNYDNILKVRKNTSNNKLDVDARSENSLGTSRSGNSLIEWTAMNTDVATYDAVSGSVVAGSSDGHALFVGTFIDVWGEKQSISIMVVVGQPDGIVVPAEDLSFTENISNVNVIIGETKEAPALTISPTDATITEIVWSSGNGAVATVDAISGTVTGVDLGQTQITATITNPNGSEITKSYTVEVQNATFIDGENGIQRNHTGSYQLIQPNGVAATGVNWSIEETSQMYDTAFTGSLLKIGATEQRPTITIVAKHGGETYTKTINILDEYGNLITPDPWHDVKTIQVGETFEASGYDWIVLHKDDFGNALILSKYIVGSTIWNNSPSEGGNVYGDTLPGRQTLRAEMQGFFGMNIYNGDLDGSGSSSGRELSPLVRKSDAATAEMSKVIGTFTTMYDDTCFPLSKQEVEAYLVGTPHLAAQTLPGMPTGMTATTYWLRTAATDNPYPNFVHIVRSDTSTIAEWEMSNLSLGVRPAMWIKLPT